MTSRKINVSANVSLFKFESILPCHYASFPMVDGNADKFLEGLEGSRDRAKVSKAGSAQTF